MPFFGIENGFCCAVYLPLRPRQTVKISEHFRNLGMKITNVRAQPTAEVGRSGAVTRNESISLGKLRKSGVSRAYGIACQMNRD